MHSSFRLNKNHRDFHMRKSLVSRYSAIGDTISCNAPIYRDRLQRQAFSAIPPLLGLSLDCDRTFLQKEVGV